AAAARAVCGFIDPTVGTPTPTPAPGPPANLVTSSAGSSVTLTWNAPASGGAPTAYIIEAGSGAGLANLANFSTGNTATSFSAGGRGARLFHSRGEGADPPGPEPRGPRARFTAAGAGVGP